VANVFLELVSVSVFVLVAGILLDIIVGDPSPNSPFAAYYKIHPTVLMGGFIKTLERHLKNPNPKREKQNGVFLGVATVLAFALPTFFGLWAIWTFLGGVSFWLGVIVYSVIAIILV
jgi:cobalamin biosynthesis protein CobD/CbiB